MTDTWSDTTRIPDVAYVFWPSESSRRAQLARERLPRLLLLSKGVPAPECDDPLEDWTREPFDGEEIEARSRRLSERAAIEFKQPRMDEHGIVRAAGEMAVLTPGQIPLARLLIDNLGYVVPMMKLEDAHSAVGAPATTLTQVLRRCRQRLAPLGLSLDRIQTAGYQLSVVQEN